MKMTTLKKTILLLLIATAGTLLLPDTAFA